MGARQVAAVAVLVLLAACTTSSDEPAATSAATSAAASSASSQQGASSSAVVSSLPPPQDVTTMDDVQAIDARPFADWVALADGSAWVANVGRGIGRYDLATGRDLGSVPTGTEICLAMDVGFDSLWAGDCSGPRVFRVDPSTGRVLARIRLPFPALAEESSLAAGEGCVFALSSFPERIACIDPARNRVRTTFKAPNTPAALRAGYGALWVTNPDPGRLVRMDPRTGKVLARIPLPFGARFLALGEDAVWVMSNDKGTVTRVDPDTNAVTATIPVDDYSVDGGDIAVGGGYVWARVSDTLVAQIDPATDRVVARYGPASGSGSVAADRKSLWISAHDVLRVWRVPLD
jgi:virginiamycin B lyase